MSEDPKKPNLEDVEMHLPEGELAIPTEEPGRLTNAPILILLGLLLLGVLAGLVWWYMNLPTPGTATDTPRPTVEENNEPESTNAEAETSTINVLSTSDELGLIEADLDGTNLETLDAELSAIESELSATAQ